MNAPQGDVAETLLRKLGASWITQVIATAAKLGLADALANGPKSSDALAAELCCQRRALGRILPVLVGEGLLQQSADNLYSLTPVGEQLRSELLGPLAVFIGSEVQWGAWTALAESVRTGAAAFRHVHGCGLYEHLGRYPADARLYDAAIDAFTQLDARALAQRYDFSAVRQVVDVGGGRGSVLFALLDRFPKLRGILFDTAQVTTRAQQRFQAAGLAERCIAIAGDFMQGVPAGADLYVLKHILHNWDDEHCVQILKHCAAALAPGGRILVVDYILLPDGRMDMTRLLDLEMMVLTDGGRERTKRQFRQLLRQAGLKLLNTLPLAGSSARLLIAEPCQAGASTPK